MEMEEERYDREDEERRREEDERKKKSKRKYTSSNDTHKRYDSRDDDPEDGPSGEGPGRGGIDRPLSDPRNAPGATRDNKNTSSFNGRSGSKRTKGHRDETNSGDGDGDDSGDEDSDDAVYTSETASTASGDPSSDSDSDDEDSPDSQSPPKDYFSIAEQAHKPVKKHAAMKAIKKHERRDWHGIMRAYTKHCLKDEVEKLSPEAKFSWYERHGSPRRPAIIQIKEEYLHRFKFTDKECRILKEENCKEAKEYFDNHTRQFPVNWTAKDDVNGLSAPWAAFGIYKGHQWHVNRPRGVYGDNENEGDPRVHNFYGELNREVFERLKEFNARKAPVLTCVLKDRNAKFFKETQDMVELENTTQLTKEDTDLLNVLSRERRKERSQQILITDQEAEMYGMSIQDRLTLMEQNGRDEWYITEEELQKDMGVTPEQLTKHKQITWELEREFEAKKLDLFKTEWGLEVMKGSRDYELEDKIERHQFNIAMSIEKGFRPAEIVRLQEENQVKGEALKMMRDKYIPFSEALFRVKKANAVLEKGAQQERELMKARKVYHKMHKLFRMSQKTEQEQIEFKHKYAPFEPRRQEPTLLQPIDLRGKEDFSPSEQKRIADENRVEMSAWIAKGDERTKNSHDGYAWITRETAIEQSRDKAISEHTSRQSEVTTKTTTHNAADTLNKDNSQQDSQNSQLNASNARRLEAEE
jgi:hypothetical protein